MQGNRIKTHRPDQNEQRLFALLRASLHGSACDPSLFSNTTGAEWQQCYRLAAAHGVMALAWDGVTRLPAELQPPLHEKLAWAAAVERYEQRYRHYCRTVDELSRFYAAHGIAVMQLKGVGFSALYPVPAHREGGDIDIYTYSADQNRMNDREANRLADDLMRQAHIAVDTEHTPKHSQFCYHGVSVENHKTFLNVEKYQVAVQMEKVLKEQMNPQPTALDGGRVLTPSPPFNTLFIAFHAAQHYAGGLALHHLCDWTCLLKNYGLHLPAGVTDRRFLRFVSALTLLSNRLLGTNIPVTEAPEELAQKLLVKMLQPRRVPAKSRIGILIYKTRRLGRRIAFEREVLGGSACREILRSVIEHIRKPETIFQRGTEP